MQDTRHTNRLKRKNHIFPMNTQIFVCFDVSRPSTRIGRIARDAAHVQVMKQACDRRRKDEINAGCFCYNKVSVLDRAAGRRAGMLCTNALKATCIHATVQVRLPSYPGPWWTIGQLPTVRHRNPDNGRRTRRYPKNAASPFLTRLINNNRCTYADICTTVPFVRPDVFSLITNLINDIFTISLYFADHLLRMK